MPLHVLFTRHKLLKSLMVSWEGTLYNDGSAGAISKAQNGPNLTGTQGRRLKTVEGLGIRMTP
jgi:hypothetical protein